MEAGRRNAGRGHRPVGHPRAHRLVRCRGRKFYRPIKKQVTLPIDADVLEWIKVDAGKEGPYQTTMNAALW